MKTPFSPEAKETVPTYDEAQRELDLLFSSRSGQITNEYIKGEERSLRLLLIRCRRLGQNYAKIFDEVIKINTLDAKLYEKVQQTMIDALDQGTCVHVRGKGENQTDYSTVISSERHTEGDNLRKLCGRCEYSCRRSIYITCSGRDERYTSCKQGISGRTSV